MATEEKIITFNHLVLRSILQLPARMRGNGDRADEYSAYAPEAKIAVLNDEEFNEVINHNTKRMMGREANAICMYNEGEGTVIAIRSSALFQIESKKISSE